MSNRKNLTHKEIATAIEEKRIASEGLLTYEAAARLIAAELGVEVNYESLYMQMQIKKLTLGLNDITTTGRVLVISKPRTFTRQNGNGQVARLKIVDKTEKIDVVLWDERTELIKKIQLGDIVRIRHAYVRRSKNGELEIHIGEKGKIQVQPPDINGIDYPTIEKFLTKIEHITALNKRTNVKGIIQRMSPISTFQRENGTQGKVARVILKDKTADISVVFWNETAEEIHKIREGDEVLLMNPKVKENQHEGKLELHLDGFSNIKITDG